MGQNDDGRGANHTLIVTFVFSLVLIVLTAITVFAIDRRDDATIFYLSQSTVSNQPVNATDIAGMLENLGTRLTIVDAWVGIAFVCFAFLFLIYLGCMKDGTLSKGELRRAVAGSLVLAFTILALFSMVMGDQNGIGKEIVIAYIQLVGIAVGFYFGAKTAERDGDDEAEPEPEPKPEGGTEGKETPASSEANLE
jgi:hypothetical protein